MKELILFIFLICFLSSCVFMGKSLIDGRDEICRLQAENHLYMPDC